MDFRLRILAGALVCAGFASAADKAPPTIAKILDGALTSAEREIVSLVEAMPADKMDFAPASGEFKGVRTFAQQATHVASVNYAVAAATLGEKNPSESGENENGPATIKTKDEVVKYLKDSFAYAHRAARSITATNAARQMASPFGEGKMPKLGAINVAIWHTFDHYGQLVVYARLNGIVPPASRQQ